MDPGGDAAKIIAEVARQGVTVSQILLTHGHLDHVGAATELAAHFDIPIYGPEKEDTFWLEGLPAQSRMFGLSECDAFTPTRWLEEGDKITVGEVELSVLHCLTRQATLFSLTNQGAWHWSVMLSLTVVLGVVISRAVITNN